MGWPPERTESSALGQAAWKMALASAACSALDGMEIAGMVGSLAGDDTGMLIMRDSASAEAFCSEAHKLLE